MRKTINNPHTSKRKELLKLIEHHGSCWNIGQAFKNGERPTNVEVVVVELVKESEDKLNLDGDFDQTKQDFSFDTLHEANEVQQYDFFKAKVQLHDVEVNAYKELVAAQMEYDRISNDESYTGYKSKVSRGEYSKELNKGTLGITKKHWDALVKESKFAELLTKRLRDDFFNKHMSKQKTIAFTYSNIMEMLGLLLDKNNKIQIFNNCVSDCFDLLTRYHKDNTTHFEGWKTNQAFKVKKRFILPNVISRIRTIFV